MTRHHAFLLAVLLAAAGCASSRSLGDESGGLAVVSLKHPQTGKVARCGTTFVPEVARKNTPSWVEEIFFYYKGRAAREAQAAVQREQEWRRQCVEHYEGQGYRSEPGPKG